MHAVGIFIVGAVLFQWDVNETDSAERAESVWKSQNCDIAHRIRVFRVPPVKTMRSESSDVYFWNAILSRDLCSLVSLERNSQPIPLLPESTCAVHFIKDRLLELRRGWENAICKCRITRKTFQFFMLLSQPLISALQFHSEERNPVNVQGWILKLKKLDLPLFLLWLIRSGASWDRSCFSASGLGPVASSAVTWRRRQGYFQSWQRSQQLLSLGSVMQFIYLFPQSSLFLLPLRI